MDKSDEIMTQLKDIQRTLAEQAELATTRWQTAVGVVVACGIIVVVLRLF